MGALAPWLITDTERLNWKESGNELSWLLCFCIRSTKEFVVWAAGQGKRSSGCAHVRCAGKRAGAFHMRGVAC